MSRAVLSPEPFGGEPMDRTNRKFFGLEQSNTKMQSEVIKVSGSKEFLTIFSGLPNEDTQKAVK
jgi:hypothetical protein